MMRNLNISKDLCNTIIKNKKFNLMERLYRDIMMKVMRIIIRNNHKFITKGIQIVIVNIRDYKENNKDINNS